MSAHASESIKKRRLTDGETQGLADCREIGGQIDRVGDDGD
jgi:hypothetical protein